MIVNLFLLHVDFSPFQKVIFEGFKNSKEAMIALDDVVLQTDKCERMPWKGECPQYTRIK